MPKRKSKSIQRDERLIRNGYDEGRRKGFHEGQEHGEQMLIGRLMDELMADKLCYIKEQMFQRAHELADKHVRGDKEWKAFAEGVRQTLNVLNSRGKPEEAYENIINRCMDLRNGKKGIKPTA